MNSSLLKFLWFKEGIVKHTVSHYPDYREPKQSSQEVILEKI